MSETSGAKYSNKTGGAYAEMKDVVDSERKRLQAKPVAAERSRLESEVISRAKKWANPDMDKSNQSVADLHLFEAVKALLSFEEENK